MTPEQKARAAIDRQLAQCGWMVQDHESMNIMAGLGEAVREFPLKSGFANYMFYVDGKAVGIIEAKPEGHTLVGVETQSAKYTSGLPDILPHYHLPLPFAYESTGTITQFTNGLDQEALGPRPADQHALHPQDQLPETLGPGRVCGVLQPGQTAQEKFDLE